MQNHSLRDGSALADASRRKPQEQVTETRPARPMPTPRVVFVVASKVSFQSHPRDDKDADTSPATRRSIMGSLKDTAKPLQL